MKLIAAGAICFFALSLTLRADTALETQMKKMEEAAKQLGADLKQTDPTKHNKDADLKSVADMKTAATSSATDEPKKAKTLPPDQEKTMTDSYQKDMNTFITHIDQLNSDIQSENWAVAQTDFQALMKEQHDDHKLYRIKKS